MDDLVRRHRLQLSLGITAFALMICGAAAVVAAGGATGTVVGMRLFAAAGLISAFGLEVFNRRTGMAFISALTAGLFVYFSTLY